MGDYKKPTEHEVGVFIKEWILMKRDDGDDVPEGWYNKFFEDKPTEIEADEWIMMNWYLKNLKSDRKKSARINKLLKGEDPNLVSSRIITLSFDSKANPELKKPETYNRAFCELYVEEFRKSNYKFIENGKMTFEFFTENGFNPHIHIYTETDKQIGAMAQVLRRKFVEKSKWKIYRVNITPGSSATQEQYVAGNNKCDEKHEFVEKDLDLRKNNNIQNSYDI